MRTTPALNGLVAVSSTIFRESQICINLVLSRGCVLILLTVGYSKAGLTWDIHHYNGTISGKFGSPKLLGGLH